MPTAFANPWPSTQETDAFVFKNAKFYPEKIPIQCVVVLTQIHRCFPRLTDPQTLAAPAFHYQS